MTNQPNFVQTRNPALKVAPTTLATFSSCDVEIEMHILSLFISIIIRPHRSTTYVDAAYCYRPSGVVCRSVCHTSEPCKNSCTNRDAV